MQSVAILEQPYVKLFPKQSLDTKCRVAVGCPLAFVKVRLQAGGHGT